MENEEHVTVSQINEVDSSLGQIIKDKLTDAISEKISEITNGNINLDSFTKLRVNGNGYVDKALESLNSQLDERGLSKIGLPSQQLQFEKSIACGIILPGDANFDNGTIKGLSTFTRMDDASLQIDVFADPIITAKVTIGIKTASLDYAVNLIVLCFNEMGSVTGTVKDVQLTLGFNMSKDFKVSLDKFDTKYTGDVDLNFENLEVFKNMSDAINDDIKKTVKESLIQYLVGNVQKIATTIISNLKIEEFLQK